MSYTDDLIGKKFGKLLVISRNYDRQKELLSQNKGNKAYCNCLCDCGKKVVVSGSNLKNKSSPTRSCGCYAKEVKHRQKNTKCNKWIIKEDTTIGITSNGDKFYIDTLDYDLVKNYCWRIDKFGYVVANSRNGSNKIIRIHRLIMGATTNDTYVDHKNWDKLNNKRSNLRIATKSQNNINIKRKSNNTTGYTGVTYNKKFNKYCARISINGKRIFLGWFDDINDAIQARHKAELDLHSEWSGEINRKDYEKHIKMKRSELNDR